jgi:sigma-B regulation protein RsbU (phosphoserine phosphatase)
MLVVVWVMIHGITRFLRERVIKPIDTLSKTAVEYTARDKTLPEETEGFFENLEINAGKEIEDLWISLSDMEDDISDTMNRIRKMTSDQERLNTELSIATQIQANILPSDFPAFPDRNDFSLYAMMTPARNVAGDFYDFFLTDDDHIALVIADVSDKGIPAALFMMTARTLVKNEAMKYGSPSEILSRVNQQLCEGNEAALFVTVWMAIIELSTGGGVVVNAGHMHPALCRAGGEYSYVEYDHSLPLGLIEDADFPQHDFHLDPGDRIFVYTDGVTDATNSSEEQFGMERLLDVLNHGKNETPEETIGAIMDSIRRFTVNEDQTDDITMLSFYYSKRNG